MNKTIQRPKPIKTHSLPGRHYNTSRRNTTNKQIWGRFKHPDSGTVVLMPSAVFDDPFQTLSLTQTEETRTNKTLQRHVNQLCERISELQSEIKQLKAQNTDYDATVTLMKRTQRESAEPRLRLLRLLRSKPFEILLNNFANDGVVDMAKNPTDIQQLNLLVEFVNLGKADFISGRFILTAAGKNLIQQYARSS